MSHTRWFLCAISLDKLNVVRKTIGTQLRKAERNNAELVVNDEKVGRKQTNS